MCVTCLYPSVYICEREGERRQRQRDRESLYIWRPEVKASYLPWSFSTLFFEIVSLTEPEAHRLSYSSHPASSTKLQDSIVSVCVDPELGLQACMDKLGFHMAAAGLNSGPHVCAPSILLTEPSAQPLFWILKEEIQSTSVFSNL